MLLCIAASAPGSDPAPAPGSASGSLDDLWQASSTSTSQTAQPATTIQAKPLRGPDAGQLTALDDSAAESQVVRQRLEALRKQRIAIENFQARAARADTAGATPMLRRMQQQYQPYTRAAGWYDVYGVYHSYAAYGYTVDEQVADAAGGYIRFVTYTPTVIYATPYACRPYPPRCGPYWRGPCFPAPYFRGPCFPARRCYDGGLTVRATGDWGFVNYNSNTCSGASLRVNLQF